MIYIGLGGWEAIGNRKQQGFLKVFYWKNFRVYFSKRYLLNTLEKDDFFIKDIFINKTN